MNESQRMRKGQVVTQHVTGRREKHHEQVRASSRPQDYEAGELSSVQIGHMVIVRLFVETDSVKGRNHIIILYDKITLN
jgi:hypothetical protein